MDINTLQARLAPYRKLCSKDAMSPVYKSLLLTATEVRGASSYGILNTSLELKLSAECFVDAHTFLNIINSLPGSAELELSLEAGALLWRCGSAKGKLATADVKAMPEIDIGETSEPFICDEAFETALTCGTLSCNDRSLATIGMYGVVMSNEDLPCICTSDNTTLSFCPFGDATFGMMPAMSCLPPDGVLLLNDLLDTKGGQIYFDTDTLYYVDDIYTYMLKTIPPLAHDVLKVLEQFMDWNLNIKMPQGRIEAFIKRATLLAESRKGAQVALGASEGRLTLSFLEGASQADEYYLLDNQTIPDMPEVKLDAAKLARALAHTDEAVLDFMDKRVVVLTNSETGFMYIVSGTTG